MLIPVLKVLAEGYDNSDAFERTVSYIYRLNQKKPLPVYAYDVWPPSYERIIQSFHNIRNGRNDNTSQFVWHLILSFGTADDSLNRFAYSLTHDIARLFAVIYPVCYAFHHDTDNFHAHLIVCSSSRLPGYGPLDQNQMNTYCQTIKTTFQPIQLIRG